MTNMGLNMKTTRNFYNVQCPFCDDRGKHLGSTKERVTPALVSVAESILCSQPVKELLGLQPKNINEILKKI